MLTQFDLEFGLGSEGMPRTKIKVFLEQFPWVLDLVGKQPISQVYVSVVETKFLVYRPCSHLFRPRLFQTWDIENEMLWFLDKEGCVVHTEVTEVVEVLKGSWFFGRERINVPKTRVVTGYVEPESTVQTTLNILGETTRKNIHFALSYYAITQAVIVYKIPKGMSISEWLSKQLETEKKTLEETCKGIDTKLVKVS